MPNCGVIAARLSEGTLIKIIRAAAESMQRVEVPGPRKSVLRGILLGPFPQPPPNKDSITWESCPPHHLVRAGGPQRVRSYLGRQNFGFPSWWV